MNKTTTALLSAVLLAQAVSASAQESVGNSTSDASTVTAPDNSRSNKVDDSNRVTAQDQLNNPKDIELTKQIRQSVTADDALSTYAHNVKIVTVNGHVTLNGVVRSEAEKTAVEKKAFDIAGRTKVASELKVAENGS